MSTCRESPTTNFSMHSQAPPPQKNYSPLFTKVTFSGMSTSSTFPGRTIILSPSLFPWTKFCERNSFAEGARENWENGNGHFAELLQKYLSRSVFDCTAIHNGSVSCANKSDLLHSGRPLWRLQLRRRVWHRLAQRRKIEFLIPHRHPAPPGRSQPVVHETSRVQTRKLSCSLDWKLCLSTRSTEIILAGQMTDEESSRQLLCFGFPLRTVTAPRSCFHVQKSTSADKHRSWVPSTCHKFLFEINDVSSKTRDVHDPHGTFDSWQSKQKIRRA